MSIKIFISKFLSSTSLKNHNDLQTLTTNIFMDKTNQHFSVETGQLHKKTSRRGTEQQLSTASNVTLRSLTISAVYIGDNDDQLNVAYFLIMMSCTH